MKVQVQYTVDLTEQEIEILRAWAEELGYNVGRPTRWWIRQVLEQEGKDAVGRSKEWASKRADEEHERQERES